MPVGMVLQACASGNVDLALSRTLEMRPGTKDLEWWLRRARQCTDPAAWAEEGQCRDDLRRTGAARRLSDDFAALLLQVAERLAALHSLRLVHGDCRPAKVALVPTGQDRDAKDFASSFGGQNGHVWQAHDDDDRGSQDALLDLSAARYSAELLDVSSASGAPSPASAVDVWFLGAAVVAFLGETDRELSWASLPLVLAAADADADEDRKVAARCRDLPADGTGWHLWTIDWSDAEVRDAHGVRRCFAACHVARQLWSRVALPCLAVDPRLRPSATAVAATLRSILGLLLLREPAEAGPERKRRRRRHKDSPPRRRRRDRSPRAPEPSTAQQPDKDRCLASVGRQILPAQQLQFRLALLGAWVDLCCPPDADPGAWSLADRTARIVQHVASDSDKDPDAAGAGARQRVETIVDTALGYMCAACTRVAETLRDPIHLDSTRSLAVAALSLAHKAATLTSLRVSPSAVGAPDLPALEAEVLSLIRGQLFCPFQCCGAAV